MSGVLLMMTRSLLAFAIVAILFSRLSSAATEVEVLDPRHLWKASIVIGTGPEWIPGTSQLRISPTTMNGQPYVPYDLSDAWKELDRMLPRDFAKRMASFSYAGPYVHGKTCLNDLDREADVLNGALIEYLAEHWFQESSRFALTLQRLVDLEAHPSIISTEHGRQVEESAASLVLCGYYNWKRSGDFPSLDFMTSLFHLEAARLRRSGPE
jgi:hypothetical protein